MAGRLEVSRDRFRGGRVQRHVADLVAFSVDAQMADAAALLQVDQVKLAQFGAAQAVVQQRG